METYINVDIFYSIMYNRTKKPNIVYLYKIKRAVIARFLVAVNIWYWLIYLLV
jgi:hypothetical protein